MQYLPIFIQIKNRPCLVVGGGSIAARKVALLRKAQGNVTVVSPEICGELHTLKDDGLIQHTKRRFEDLDLENAVLVIAATNQRAVNEHVSKLAHKLRLPVNVVDNPDLCSFIMPSIIDRSPVVIAVSTGGSSPVLARLIRTKLEGSIPAAYGRLAKLVEGFRNKVKTAFPNVESRRGFWESILEGTVAELVFTGHEEEAKKILDEAIDKKAADNSTEPEMPGEVFLVGAGPGDPDLLTFRALRLMQQADVVVYDRLVSPAIMEMVRRDAEIVYVGKERDKHIMQQENINQLLVRLAKEGKRVLRLKGGDPFIFGRGGEEIELLAEEGIAFQVVPGITAANGCSSYAGIPLTHRDYAQSCVFVTGHLKDGSVDLNWKALAHPHQTVVFYMGLHGAPTLCKEMVAHGLPASTPVALVEQGTTPQQRVLIATLDTLLDVIKNEEIKPPTLIIVGEVVTLHEKLSWLKECYVDNSDGVFAYKN
ncbi:Precorrin-2 oxidase @ Sirohydrochlorin ferrochelatase activity of CysG / Uroporphyrinogen-III methyltransferase [hydrothermal vent metagenome]|uniref:Precorrin-2 oxidase @ Sirohydrochlorin ferrochelatase activity of CysG / Uroporphyrinogen-III methyltransferase n=1 Tax=hydrothermal vent metagenome TaxID=652676 RepID=A0A3B0WH36_9ZZZZ